MVSKNFSVARTCSLCFEAISKFVIKQKKSEKKNPNCKCKECKCSK